MSNGDSNTLGIIAGNGAYPIELARSARLQGVSRIVAVAFRKETRPEISEWVDEVTWLPIGQLQAMLDAFAGSETRQVVMAGQISPTHLFRVRPDRRMLDLLAGLRERNAHTIFGAVGEHLANIGIELKPASLFMEAAMPEPGVLTERQPTDREKADLQLGIRVARTTSGLDIGQTVVVKEGTILAVEAFEGTDDTIKRAGRLGGAGAVAVKWSKPGHDIRFDIPVIGTKTLKRLKKAGVSALAVQAGYCILLERERVIETANEQGLCIVAMNEEQQPDE
jgi:hypothetical protein